MAPDGNQRNLARGEVRPYSVLRLDFLVLLVPQHDVRTLEPAADVDMAEPPQNGVGWIHLGNQRYPVFCFSEQLKRLDEVPATRRICAVLAAGEGAFGLLCSDVSLLRLPDVRLSPMPEAMILPGRPIQGLVLHEDRVMCLSSAARLIAHARAGAEEPHERAVEGKT